MSISLVHVAARSDIDNFHLFLSHVWRIFDSLFFVFRNQFLSTNSFLEAPACLPPAKLFHDICILNCKKEK